MLRDKIYIASDHAGFELKRKLCEFLKTQNINFEDLGTHTSQSCDYTTYAHLLASKIDEKSFGVLLCGSGVGVSISANRHKNIRCVLCSELLSARLAREHNDANILAMGGRLVGELMAIEILKVFINTPFSNEERHLQRIEKIEEF